MRVSTQSLQLQWLADVYRRQSSLARIQNQVSSGLRITTAADDPAGAGQIVSLRQGIDRLENFDANGEAVRRRLALEEQALDNFSTALTRVRELGIQAGGGIQANDTRQAIAAEMRELLANMVDIANSQDGEGRYLFAGNAAGSPPVTIVNGVATYEGDDGTRSQRIGDSRVVREGDPGSEVFFGIRNGNGRFFVEPGTGNTGTGFFSNATVSDAAAWVNDTYTLTFTSPTSYEVTDSASNSVATGSWAPGETITFRGASIAFEGNPAAGDTFSVSPSENRSVFAMVGGMIDALEGDTLSPIGRAGFQNALNAVLLDFDRAETHLGNIRSQVGARLAAVEEQRSNNADLALQLETTLSSVRDVDLPKAISELELNLTALEAAQRVFAQTRSLSLFDVL
jgi:flagellar hook-associated protein 3 FlgL